MTDGLLEVADELYALPLDRFTPARDARAKEAKGDKDLVAALKALRKPSLAAWVVNLLVRREAEQVEQVLAVGAALREAQEGMDGAELRALTKQRRQLTAAVTAQARALAADEGVRVTQAVADQVEATLTAAMVDPEAARAVRSGLLVRRWRRPGSTRSTSRPRWRCRRRSASRPADDRRRRPRRPSCTSYRGTTAARRREEAGGGAGRGRGAPSGEAEQELGHRADAVEKLQARSLQLQAEIDELRRRLAELESSGRGDRRRAGRGRGRPRRGRAGPRRRRPRPRRRPAGPRPPSTERCRHAADSP